MPGMCFCVQKSRHVQGSEKYGKRSESTCAINSRVRGVWKDHSFSVYVE